MKKLVKIRLINWYTYCNVTIEISGNTLISGQNGGGKSTLIDAIQYVLTAGNAKFNKAANEKSDRTLESYVRGQLNMDSKAYLRDGDVNCYIALELKDTDTNRIDIIGAAVECPTASKLSRIFFKITNQELNDDLFVINGMVKTIREFKANKSIEIFDTKQNISMMIKSVLGITKDKYFELLNRALAFKPIPDINDFVNNFLLPENKIDLEKLEENITNVRKLEEIIINEEEKVKELEKIENINNNYQKSIQDVEKYNYLKTKLQINKINLDIKKNQDEDKKLSDAIANNNKLLTGLDKERNNILETIEELKESNNNKDVNLYLKLTDDINTIKTKIEQKKVSYDLFFKDLDKEKKLLNSDIKLITKDNTDNALIYLKNHQLKIEAKKKDLTNQRMDFEERKKSLEPKIEETSKKLVRLMKNQLPYNDTVLHLQKEIKDELSKRYNQDIEVRPLCEYLKIKDLEWDKAIEGYLNHQRFDLIIEPKYFDDALEIYENRKKEMKIYGVGVVNTRKLVLEEIEDNTLASKIDSDNTYALMYAIKLLNHVVCCDKVEDLKKYFKSITKTCMTYRNHVARQINPKAYEDMYIGERAKEIQLEKYKAKYQEYKESRDDINNNINDIDIKLENLQKTKIIDLINNVSVLDDYKVLNNQLEEKTKLSEEFKNDGLLFDIIEKINLKKKELDEVLNKIKNIENNNNINTLRKDEIENSLKELELEKNNLTSTIKSNESFELDDKINLYNIDSKINESLQEKVKQETILENALINYNNNFQFDEIPKVENINHYLETLYQIKETDLIKYRSDSIKLKESCQRTFKEDFLVNLRYLIDEAKSEIKSLNKALKDKKFGKERYELVYRKSDDNELGKYFDIIESGANYVGNSLFSEDLTIEQLNDLEELFNRLLVSNSDNTKNIINEYTDYRRYMNYDIKVTNDDNETYSFGKVSKGKSGGEIQTPFYVMIAASFEQLMRLAKRDNVGCIVLLDEAFSNMDELRIEAMMEFYKSLNIQLLIAVPTTKVPYISPYVDTNLVIDTVKYQTRAFRVETNLKDNYE